MGIRIRAYWSREVHVMVHGLQVAPKPQRGNTVAKLDQEDFLFGPDISLRVGVSG
jgi:hypothetical protein